jgi:DNA-binding transcriptional regulator YiaG
MNRADSKLLETDMNSGYRYVESGLDDVFIEGLPLIVDDAGEDVIAIPNIHGLHAAIAEAIVTKPSSLTGKELRFLRTEMGLTQSDLAALIHREPLAISRWERGEVTPMDANAEVVIRLHAREALGLSMDASVKAIAESVVPGATNAPLRIDGSNPDDYRPLPRAA